MGAAGAALARRQHHPPAYLVEEVLSVVETLDIPCDLTSVAVIPLSQRSSDFKAEHLNKTLEEIESLQSKNSLFL